MAINTKGFKMTFRIKMLLLCCALVLLSLAAKALTDYASPTSDYEGEYKSTHDDISTLGEPEKEPTLKQAEEIREKNLEAEVKPKVEPVPDLDLTKPEDKALMNTIENGEQL